MIGGNSFEDSIGLLDFRKKVLDEKWKKTHDG